MPQVDGSNHGQRGAGQPWRDSVNVREVWRTHPVHRNYAVSSHGRVKRLTAAKGTRPGKILNPGLSSSGYKVVSLNGAMRKVHRLMLEAFRRLPLHGEQARHRDDVKTNNVLRNLVWGSRSANYEDRVRNGGGNHGSRHGMSKLTEAQVVKMRKLSGNLSRDQLALMFGVQYQTVGQILRRERWRHV